MFPEHSVEDNLLIGAKKAPAGEDYWNLTRVYDMFPARASEARMAGSFRRGAADADDRAR